MTTLRLALLQNYGAQHDSLAVHDDEDGHTVELDTSDLEPDDRSRIVLETAEARSLAALLVAQAAAVDARR